MNERTTSRVIPRIGPNDAIPVLTEVIELPDEVPADAAADADADAGTMEAVAPDTAPHLSPPSPVERPAWEPPGMESADEPVDEAAPDGQTPEPEAASQALVTPADVAEADALADTATEEDLRAVRTELLARVMMRFRTEWPSLVHAQTDAALQERLAPLASQIANELTRALEARLVEWLDAALEDIERDPSGK